MDRSVAVLWIASCLVLSTAYRAAAQAGSVEIELEEEAAPASTPAPAPAAPPDDAAPPAAAPPAAPPPAVPPPAVPPPAAPVTSAETDALIARIEALEARTAELQEELAATKASADASAATLGNAPNDRLGWSRVDRANVGLGWAWEAFVQAQYESSQVSENQLQPGGEVVNRDRFLVRRARLRVDHRWEYAALAFELDANTVRGQYLGLRRLQGLVRYPARTESIVPYVSFTLGIQDQNFGHELPFGARLRLFADRSIASNAFFPNEADVGASVGGGYGVLRYSAALLNGHPGDPFLFVDPNAGKDLVVRVGFETQPIESMFLKTGVSFLRGSGFSPGRDANKGEFRWIDDNQDNAVQNTELRPIGAIAAEPSESFDRWAFNFDALAALRTPLGVTQLYGEITLAENLDRGLYVADPVVGGGDVRELGYYLAFTQDITPYFIVGFRLEHYDGNSDFIETRRGRVVPASRSVTMYSPVAGVQLPGVARLSLQYDFIDDALGRDDLGVPTDLRNDQWTLRLQVGL